MNRPLIEPVTEAVLPEFAQFLHDHLQSERSVAQWVDGLKTGWSASQPNYGFILRNEGRIVGGIGAYYADRLIRGNVERFCNITSWCVLDAYRQQSMRLAMAVLGQPGYHFTDFSPTKVVGATLKFFKFKEMDERRAVFPNLPGFGPAGIRVLDRRADIEAALEGNALQAYRDHAIFPWLCHALVGKPGEWCHVIFKRRTFKRLPAADIIYMSDPKAFSKGVRAFSRYLLTRGIVTTHAECRSLDSPPVFSVIRTGFIPKVFLSSTLTESDIDYLYSETVALDL